MAKVTFIGPGPADGTIMGGQPFPLNEPVEIDEAGAWWQLLGSRIRRNVYFRVEDIAPGPQAAAFDHDGDGNPGGSLPAESRGLDALYADAEALGIKIDRRWGRERLQAEIDKALAG